MILPTDGRRVMSETGFVLHLTLDVTTAEQANRLSRHLLRLMGNAFPEIDAAFSSISAEDQQNHRSYLFCGRRISNNHQRCLRSPSHDGDHSTEWQT